MIEGAKGEGGERDKQQWENEKSEVGATESSEVVE